MYINKKGTLLPNRKLLMIKYQANKVQYGSKVISHTFYVYIENIIYKELLYIVKMLMQYYKYSRPSADVGKIIESNLSNKFRQSLDIISSYIGIILEVFFNVMPLFFQHQHSVANISFINTIHIILVRYCKKYYLNFLYC